MSKKKKKQQLSAAEIAAQNEAMEAAEIQRAFEQGTNTLRDLISPSAIEIHSDYFRLGNKYGRTLYVYGYPRTLFTGWLSPIINIDEVLDVSMYIYPVESAVVMKNLKTKVTQLEASMNLNMEKGKVRDPDGCHEDEAHQGVRRQQRTEEEHCLHHESGQDGEGTAYRRQCRIGSGGSLRFHDGDQALLG